MPLKAFLIFLALSIGLFNLALAASSEANVTVNVTVAPVTEITVVPNYLEWANLNPGSAGEPKYVDVKNTGSTPINQVYVYASTLTDETERPYGSTDPSKYSAAGVIVIKNETDNIPQFVGRIEWNWTDTISGADFSAVGNAVAWGFYKNTSFEYVWAVGADPSTGRCNDTEAKFAIEDDVDIGTTETRRPTTTGITRDGGDAQFGYFSVSNRAAFGNDNVCIAVATDCSKIYIYKYDKRDGFSTCANSQYLTTRTLAPGDILRLEVVNAYVPKGIPAGILKTGTITFVGISL